MAAKKTYPELAKAKPDLKWFQHDRFGMFIHWGLYALPARHEWVRRMERMTDEQYQKYFDHFNPDLYDPKEWARAAKNAGMKYFCITTKHHEGFCLWDSKYTDWKCTKTPYGKDLLKPMVKAFREEGLKIGFYHSLIDWHHPENRVDRIHPRAEDAEYRKANQKRDQKKYAQYLYNQVKELMTQFGQVDYLFFDFSYPGEDGKGRDDWDSVNLLKMVRKLQPKIIVDDRLDLMDVPGGWDIKTPEQYLSRDGATHDGKPCPWETCQTFSGSWGYHRDESSWKSAKQLLAMLIESVSKGGNLLLNVGPTARGQFDQRALDRLEGMGKWMKQHDRAIYGCTRAPKQFQTPANCLLTYNPKINRMYVHVLDWRFGEIDLPSFAGKVEYAQLLNDASEIQFVEPQPKKKGTPSMANDLTEGMLTLRIPVQQPLGVEIPVIELFMK
jgi:alpha-L-fucosidase